jgi:hypothetical protein
MSRAIRSWFLAAVASLALAATGCGGVPNYGVGGGLIGLLCLIAWVVAIVQVLQSGLPTDKKILWLLVVILLPLLGSILWFILGRK